MANDKGKEQKSAQEAAAAKAKEKLDAFKRIGNKRVPKMLKAIENVTALANQRSYTWDAQQLAKIIGALDAKVAALKTAFSNPGKGTADAGFEL